jgi:hypothetical protein
VSIDTDGARKLKLKKGALVVYLDAEFTVDQLTRWVKTTLITDDVSEKDFVRREPLSAGGWTRCRLHGRLPLGRRHSTAPGGDEQCTQVVALHCMKRSPTSSQEDVCGRADIRGRERGEV